MKKYVELDSLWKCETCFHHQNGKCNIWCDAMESYRPAYDKLTIVEGNLKLCPKCDKLMSFNSYFSAFYCTSCGHMQDKI